MYAISNLDCVKLDSYFLSFSYNFKHDMFEIDHLNDLNIGTRLKYFNRLNVCLYFLINYNYRNGMFVL